MVAQVRGAEFHQVAGHAYPLHAAGDLVAVSALRDVSSWLGFSTIRAYTEAVIVERARIFYRARD